MGFLSKSDKEVWAQDEVKKYEDELKPVLGATGISNLKNTLAIIAEQQGFEVLTIWDNDVKADKEKELKRCSDFISMKI